MIPIVYNLIKSLFENTLTSKPSDMETTMVPPSTVFCSCSCGCGRIDPRARPGTGHLSKDLHPICKTQLRRNLKKLQKSATRLDYTVCSFLYTLGWVFPLRNPPQPRRCRRRTARAPANTGREMIMGHLNPKEGITMNISSTQHFNCWLTSNLAEDYIKDKNIIVLLKSPTAKDDFKTWLDGECPQRFRDTFYHNAISDGRRRRHQASRTTQYNRQCCSEPDAD